MSIDEQFWLRCLFVVTSDERTERRIAPILRRQKEKCTESHSKEKNNAPKYRREK